MKKRIIPVEETPQSKKKKVEFPDDKPAVAASFSVTKLQKPQVSPPVVGEAFWQPRPTKKNDT
jgi:DNA-directed RNA polymerase I subunit RPA49